MDQQIPVPGKMRCPYCGYGLLGLPPVHTCPECGFEYDPHCAVIRLRGRSSDAGNFIGGLVVLLLLLYPARRNAVPVQEIWPCAAPLLLFMTVWLYRLTRNWGRQSLLIANRAGVQFQHPDLSQAVISWTEFGKARVSWITGRFRIESSDGQTLLKCRYYQAGSIFLMRECVETLNRLAKLYREDFTCPVPVGGEVPGSEA